MCVVSKPLKATQLTVILIVIGNNQIFSKSLQQEYVANKHYFELFKDINIIISTSIQFKR